MTICVLSDIHGSTAHLKALGPKLSKADLVILAGDLTHFGDKKEVKRVLAEIQAYNSNIIAVHGNCDTKEAADYMLDKGISIHGTTKEIDGVTFAG